MKPHISKILNKGVTLKAKKIKLTKKHLELIEKTVKEQERVLALKKIPDSVYQQKITI
jgi:DNA-binding response OmpR family regulator